MSTVTTQLSGTFAQLRSVLWSLPISIILSNFAEAFTEFREKRFWLLWRGSRDGFTAEEYQRRCDGHANTLTVVFDTE
jgi:hypothetical protein